MSPMEVAFVGFVSVCSLAILVMIGALLHLVVSDHLESKRKGY